MTATLSDHIDNNTEVPLRIGLALSGGGFRASLFHLGTIRYLEETGIMPRVEVVSTVSGGSIIGAYYLVEMERRLRANPKRNRLEACDEVINEFARLLYLNFRMRALVFYPFYHPIQTLLALLRLRHAGDTMALEFERHMFAPELRVGDLPVARVTPANTAIGEQAESFELDKVGTRILINTTSLITGQLVVFSRESDTGIRAQLSKSDPNSIPLARAVGASAAVPGLFKPLCIGNEVLSDGGVIDNQGIESLLDYFEITEQELNLLPAQFRQPPEMQIADSSVFLIISDGAGQFSVKPAPTATRAQSASRSTSILQAANRRKVLKLLLDSKKNGDLQGFAFTHLAMNVKAADTAEGGSSQRLPSEFVGPTAELRTDLDEFSRLERDALIFHGYTLMRHQTNAYGKKLLEATPDTRPAPIAPNADESQLFTWPPPFVSLCDPSSGNERRATQARRSIQRFLKFGRHTAFRDLRRFPGTFLPLLVVFLILGRVFSYLLIDLKINDSVGSVRDMIRDRISDLVTGLIPRVDIPWIINLKDIDGSQFSGTLNFAASLICIGVAFYVSLWLYWRAKRLFELPNRRELAMLTKLGKFHEKRIEQAEATAPDSIVVAATSGTAPGPEKRLRKKVVSRKAGVDSTKTSQKSGPAA
jgi:NTE family protein